MRLWIIHQHAILPNQAGIMRHFALARELAVMGHDVTIFTSGKDHSATETSPGEQPHALGETMFHEGVRFRFVPTSGYRTNGFLRIIDMLRFKRKCCSKAAIAGLETPDAVMGSAPHPFSAWAGMVLAKRMKVPFLYEIRDLWPATLVKAGGIHRLHPVVLLFGIMERVMARRADLIVGPLERAHEYFAPFGISPEKFHFLPNGFDSKLLPALDEGPAAPRDTFDIVYSGAHGLINSLHLVVEAAAMLQDQPKSAQVRFRFVGDGPLKQDLIRQANDLGVRTILFEPSCQKGDVLDRIKDADAFIVLYPPTDLYDWGSSPNKLFEYFACAKPVLSGVMTRFDPVIHERAGVHFLPTSAENVASAVLELLAETTEERAAMGRRGRQLVESQFNFSKISAAFGARLETLAEKAEGKRQR